MKYIFCLLLFFISLTCIADVYTETDAQGNVTFSDTPLSDKSKKLSNTEINQSSTIQSQTSQENENTNNNASSSEKISTNKPYTQFEITSPVNEGTIQNQSTIFVDLKTDPSLQPGDKIQIYLDGAPWGGANNATHFEFPQPDRGTHTISAKLIDSNQIVLKQSNSVTVYIHRAHLGTPPQ